MFLKNFFKSLKKSDKNNEYSKLCVYAASDTGKIRQHNEDNFLLDNMCIRDEECCTKKIEAFMNHRRVFAVFDGMGGEAFGDKASFISADTFSDFAVQFKKSDSFGLNKTVNKYVSEANNRVCKMAMENNCKMSGSTIAMVCIEQNTVVYPYNVGDSRIYYYDNNNNTLTQITEDQTLAVKKLKANIYTEEEARKSRDAHKLTSFIGVDDKRMGLNALSYKPFSLNNGIILICSDGLTDMCSDEEIAGILNHCNENPIQVNPAKALVNKALDNGGADNVTCIVILQSA